MAGIRSVEVCRSLILVHGSKLKDKWLERGLTMTDGYGITIRKRERRSSQNKEVIA